MTAFERANPQHRPLIDFIPENLHEFDVSDEEDGFYAVDEGDSLLHPKWRAVLTQTANRVPRRLQRIIGIYGGVALVLCIAWFAVLGPIYRALQPIDEMEMPEASFGKNKRPEFDGMVHVKKLDDRWLPKGEGRLIVVGDVHGCRKELEHLMQKVEFVKGRDHLILTGDIIAKGAKVLVSTGRTRLIFTGPDSPGVVSYASNLGASCVRGNHEDKVLLTFAEIESAEAHNASHRKDEEPPEDASSHSSQKLRKLARSFKKSQIAWLKACPVILHVGQIGALHDVVVVHAGLVPDIPLEDQDPFQVMNMRSINLKTRIPSEGREGTPWYELWNHVQSKREEDERQTVIYGHDRKLGLTQEDYSIGLDSGCVSGGDLTAMVIREDGLYHFVRAKCKGY